MVVVHEGCVTVAFGIKQQLVDSSMAPKGPAPDVSEKKPVNVGVPPHPPLKAAPLLVKGMETAFTVKDPASDAK